MRRPIFNSTIQLVVVNLYIKFEVSILNGCKDIFDEKSGEKEKRINIGRTNRRRPIFNSRIQLVIVNCIPNMKFLSYTVVEITLMKNAERKKNR